MGAHHFVKAALVRTNPGGSTSNYKIQATDGTPLTLGDLTARRYDEILVISGARKNPGHSPTTYPVVSPDFNYPSYQSRNIIGNDIAKLLPKDIDIGMLERLSAEVGTFSALNTITRLMYTIESSDETKPETAAMIQRYANATRNNPIRSNPGRPFFATDLNDTYRGILSPEEATRQFAEQQLGLVMPTERPHAAQAIDRARIINKYGLSLSDVERFVDDVLTPYLAVSGSNANMMHALRSENVRQDLETQIYGRRSGAERLDSIYEHNMFRKLVALTPMKAEEFYDGIDYALVAHPAFMRQSLANSVVHGQFVRSLLAIVEQHPQNSFTALSPNAIGGDPGSRLSFVNFLRNITDPGNVALQELVESQAMILEPSTTAETVNAMRALFDETTRDQDLAPHMRALSFNRLVSYVRDVGGFRPTAPPYWPRPVVFAMMDTIKENWDIVQDPSQQISAVFLGMNYRRVIGNRRNVSVTIRGIDDGGDEVVLPISLAELDSIAQEIGRLAPRELGRMMAGRNASTILNSPFNINARLPEPDVNVDAMAALFGRPPTGTPATTRILRIVAFTMAITTNDGNFFRSYITNAEGAGGIADMTREQIVALRTQIVAAIQNQIAIAERNHIANLPNQNQSRTVNLLSMFMSIEDRARNQYNYNMSENDRAFALYLLDMTFQLLRTRTAGDVANTVDADREVSEQLQAVLEGYADREPTMGALELQNRIAFEGYMRSMESAYEEAIMAGAQITEADIMDYFQTILDLPDANYAEFAVRRIEQARDNVIAAYNGQYQVVP